MERTRELPPPLWVRSFRQINDLTGTPFGPTETIGTTPTATGSGLIVTPETTSIVLETATTSAGGLITTPAVGTQAPAAGVTRTPGIPVTGQDIMLVECQFCVDTRAHALLVLPDTATFQITSPAVTANTTTDTQPTCTTVEINNGRQVVLCSGPEMTPLVVNICTDASHCTDFPVDLLACPLSQGGTSARLRLLAQREPVASFLRQRLPEEQSSSRQRRGPDSYRDNSSINRQ